MPAVGKPNLEIVPGTIEVSLGQNGERGLRVESLKPARQIAEQMTQSVLNDHAFAAGTKVAVLLSGLGATATNELYVLYDRIEQCICDRGLTIHRAFVGNYFTSLDMVGATLTIMALDDETKALLDAPSAALAM